MHYACASVDESPGDEEEAEGAGGVHETGRGELELGGEAEKEGQEVGRGEEVREAEEGEESYVCEQRGVSWAGSRRESSVPSEWSSSTRCKAVAVELRNVEATMG